jgi:hypothetical protein
MKKIFVAAAAIMMLSCSLLNVQSPEKARKTANEFLNALYFRENPAEALAMASDSFRKAGGSGILDSLLQKMKRDFVKLEALKAEAYLHENTNEITVLFLGVSEKAFSYHRLVLSGNSYKGYTVESISLSEMPYKGYRTLKNFPDAVAQ